MKLYRLAITCNQYQNGIIEAFTEEVVRST